MAQENDLRSHVSYPCVFLSECTHRLISSSFRRNGFRFRVAPCDYGVNTCTSAGSEHYSAPSRALRSKTFAHNPVFESWSRTRYATPISTASKTPNTNFQFIGQRPLPPLPRFAHHSTRFIVSRPSRTAAIAIPTIQRKVSSIFAPLFAQPADFGTVICNRASLLRVNQTAALRSRVSSSIDIFPIHSV